MNSPSLSVKLLPIQLYGEKYSIFLYGEKYSIFLPILLYGEKEYFIYHHGITYSIASD